MLILAIIMISFMNSYSQDIIAKDYNGNELVFKVIQNEYKKMNNLYLGADFLNASIAAGICAGFGVSLRHKLSESLDYNIKYFRPYTSVSDSRSVGFNETEINNGVNVKLWQVFETGITFNLITKTKEMILPINFYTEVTSDSNIYDRTYYKTYYVLKTKMPRTVQYGLRAGYYYYQHSKSNPEEMIAVSRFNTPVFHTSVTMNNAYAGISFSKYEHFVIESDIYHTTRKNLVRTYYVDYLYGLGGSYDNYHASTPDGVMPYDTSMNMSTIKHGVRLGIDYYYGYRFSKHIGYKFGLEFGWQPIHEMVRLFSVYNPIPDEYQSNRFMMTLKLGLYFSGKTHSI